jgi:hypothetical protein
MNSDLNKKIDDTLGSLDNAKRVVAPKTLKKKVLEKVAFVRQEAKIVPISYYYRAGIAAAVLVFVNAFAIIQNRENRAKQEITHGLAREYYGSAFDNF